MDEELKRAGDQFARRNARASRALSHILDISYEEQELPRPALRTGILSLDMALGGGLASGIVELHGDESTGKTALLGYLIGAAQRRQFATALCPTEYLDIPYLEDLGVDPKLLAIIRGSIGSVQPLARDFLCSDFRLLAVDSLTALRPADESYENWNEEVFHFLSLLSSVCSSSSVVVVTNQSRARRSIRPGKVLTRGTETAARRFTDLFNVRLEVGRDQVSRDTYTMVVNIEANVLSKPAVLVQLPVRKGYGVQVSLDTLRVALERGYIEQAGSRYYLNGEELGHGEKEAAAALGSTPGLLSSLQDVLLG